MLEEGKKSRNRLWLDTLRRFELFRQESVGRCPFSVSLLNDASAFRSRVLHQSCNPRERTKAGLSGLENSKSEACSDIYHGHFLERWLERDEWNDGWSVDEWNDDRNSVGWHGTNV